MKAISKEAKKEIIEQFRECMKESLMKTPDKNSFERAFALCAGVVESFPVSDGWIPVSEEMNLENYEHVFVYKEGWKKPIPAIFIKMEKRKDRFRSADAGGTLLEPTHYMKVSNPPTSNK